jgi:hypothetical protein
MVISGVPCWGMRLCQLPIKKVLRVGRYCGDTPFLAINYSCLRNLGRGPFFFVFQRIFHRMALLRSILNRFAWEYAHCVGIENPEGMASYDFWLVPQDDVIAQIWLFFSRTVHMLDIIVQMISFFYMLYLRVFPRAGNTGIFYMTCTPKIWCGKH